MRVLRDRLKRTGNVKFKGSPTRAEQFVLDEWARSKRTPEQQEAREAHLEWLARQNAFDRQRKAAEKREPFSYHVRQFIYIWSNFLGLAVIFAFLWGGIAYWKWSHQPEPRQSYMDVVFRASRPLTPAERAEDRAIIDRKFRKSLDDQPQAIKDAMNAGTIIPVPRSDGSVTFVPARN